MLGLLFFLPAGLVLALLFVFRLVFIALNAFNLGRNNSRKREPGAVLLGEGEGGVRRLFIVADAGVEHVETAFEFAAVKEVGVLRGEINTPRRLTRSNEHLRAAEGKTCESRTSLRFCDKLKEDNY